MFERRAADRYRLRMHRARSVALTSDEIVEVRAAQRTFEGAYVRTALSQFSFALVVLKIFSSEFYSIGALFAIYGTGVLIIGLFRRQQGNKQFFSEVGDDGVHRHKFRTSGNAVVILTALSIAAYATLIALTLSAADDTPCVTAKYQEFRSDAMRRDAVSICPAMYESDVEKDGGCQPSWRLLSDMSSPGEASERSAAREDTIVPSTLYI